MRSNKYEIAASPIVMRAVCLIFFALRIPFAALSTLFFFPLLIFLPLRFPFLPFLLFLTSSVGATARGASITMEIG